MTALKLFFFHMRSVLNGSEIDMVPGIRLKYEMGVDVPSGRMKAVKVLLDTPGAGNVQPATPEEVNHFLLLNPVEDHAAANLRSLDPMVQKMVMNRGSLEDARDPSAMLSSRISKINASFMEANQGPGYGKAAGGFPLLPGASPYALAPGMPMMKGGMPMMKGAPYGKGGKGGKGGVPESDTLFVKSLPLESTTDAVHSIFSQYGGVKSVNVLQPSGGRNVVAAFVIMNSVEEAKRIVENVNGQVPTGLQTPVQISFATPRGEDWVCQSCGDHQFARNTFCRSCGAPKPPNMLGVFLNPM